jgi:hypothetical protein
MTGVWLLGPVVSQSDSLDIEMLPPSPALSGGSYGMGIKGHHTYLYNSNSPPDFPTKRK